MASANRTRQFTEVHKVLKRHYKLVQADPERPVLEHLLLACCLENAHYEPAEETFAALVHTFFDWNEVRVTSIRELAEVMARLPDPRVAANRLKRVLQGVFEETYSFDLEDRRKKNLGPTIKWLQKIDGTTDFSVAYVVQSALGGHAIPVDSGAVGAMYLVELATDEDLQAVRLPGLGRAVSKAKGVEFGSLLHQLGADFTSNPYSPALQNILSEINPNVAERLPKRRAAKPVGKESLAEQSKSSHTAQKKEGTEEKKKAAADKKTSASPEKHPSAAKKKPGAKKKTSSARDKGTPESTPPETASKKGKSASERLSKRKPR